jgi:hypothetical protein
MSILSYLFPQRLQLFHATDYAGVIDIEMTHERCRLQLISVKMHDDSLNGAPRWSSQSTPTNTLQCYYWTVSGPHVATCSPQAALEDLGCFGTLDSRKVCMLVMHSDVR